MTSTIIQKVDTLDLSHCQSQTQMKKKKNEVASNSMLWKECLLQNTARIWDVVAYHGESHEEGWHLEVNDWGGCSQARKATPMQNLPIFILICDGEGVVVPAWCSSRFWGFKSLCTTPLDCSVHMAEAEENQNYLTNWISSKVRVNT